MFKSTKKRYKSNKRNRISKEPTKETISFTAFQKSLKKNEFPSIKNSQNNHSTVKAENSYEDYSIHSLLERIKNAKLRMISRRRSEIKSLQSKKNSKI